MRQILTALPALPALLPVLLIATACTGDETVRAHGAGDRIWTLEAIDGAPFEANATMRFPEAGRIAGKAPCNSYAGTMETPYPWFETGPLAVTRMMCPEMEAETAFFAALDKMRQVEVLGDVMVLRPEDAEDDSEMVFRAGE